jgi:hypothetical protein
MMYAASPKSITSWYFSITRERILSGINPNLFVADLTKRQAQEQPVGQFQADIVCKDRPTGPPVLIENQLAKSDHGHLNQLLTYAAGPPPARRFERPR